MTANKEFMKPTDFFKHIKSEIHNPNRRIEQLDLEEVNSIDEYMIKIESYRKNERGDELIFRGQRSLDWSLLPKICRDRIHFDSTDIEKRMLEDFKNIIKIKHKTIFESYTNDWEYLALAQHYGMTTRFLDWTYNSLTALWFACFDKHGKYHTNDNAVVYLYYSDNDDSINPMISNPFEVESYKIYKPIQGGENARSNSQSALFTIHTFNSELKEFPVFDDYNKINKKIIRLIIKSDVIPKLINELIEIGYTHSKIYPDLDGVCKEVEWKYNKILKE